MPLIPLILALAPTAASWVMGDKTGAAITKVTGIAREILGADDANGIEAAIARDPNLAMQFKLALVQAEADARRVEFETLQAQLADVQSARNQTVKLAESGSMIAWGAPAASIMSLILAGGVVYLVLFPDVNSARWTETVVTMLVGAAINWVASVQGYWLGSSAGSVQKNAAIATAIEKK